MGAILGPLISSPRGAGYMSIPVMVLIAISGIFYPITALPEWLQWVAQVFPIYWLGLGMRSALLPRNTGQARGPRRAPQLAGVMIGGPHHDVTALLSGEGARGGQDGLRVRLRIYRQRRIVVCADDRHRGCHQQCRPPVGYRGARRVPGEMPHCLHGVAVRDLAQRGTVHGVNHRITRTAGRPACLPEPACPHPDDLIGVTAGGEGAELSGSHRVGEVGGDAGDTNRALLQRASFPACEQGGS